MNHPCGRVIVGLLEHVATYCQSVVRSYQHLTDSPKTNLTPLNTMVMVPKAQNQTLLPYDA